MSSVIATNPVSSSSHRRCRESLQIKRFSENLSRNIWICDNKIYVAVWSSRTLRHVLAEMIQWQQDNCSMLRCSVYLTVIFGEEERENGEKKASAQKA